MTTTLLKQKLKYLYVKDPTQITRQSALPERSSADPPCQESAGFRPKAPQQMLFSVEDVARCQAVCGHNGGRVAARIKLFIHIIILRRIQASQTKLLGIGDFCAVGPGGTFGSRRDQLPAWSWLFMGPHVTNGALFISNPSNTGLREPASTRTTNKNSRKCFFPRAKRASWMRQTQTGLRNSNSKITLLIFLGGRKK